MPESERDRKATRAELRALAHPLRLELYERLREGSSTASRLARQLGESSGATSYHLRVLARAGLVEEDEERGGGRTRWWRRRWPRGQRYLVLTPEWEDAEGRALAAEMRGAFAARDDEVLRRFAAREPDLDDRWRAKAFVGSWSAFLTPDDAEELGRRVLELVAELRRRPPPSGSQRALVTFRALPWLEDEPAEP